MESRWAEWVFTAELQSLADARRLIAASLHHLPDESLFDVLLLANEVMANALVHGTGAVGLHLWWDAKGVRVEVADQSPEVPVVRSLDLEAENGRGLLFIDTLSSKWGVMTRGTRDGKTVWFDLHT